MSEDMPVVAIMYDFDKTLCTKNMQEYGFMKKIDSDPETFWTECSELIKKEQMNPMLAYMWLMVNKYNKKDKTTRREDFVELGKDLKYYPGVKGWFERINEYGRKHGVRIEHYIISSGLVEIIEGSSIGKNFRKIYACEFYYDHNGLACWPKTVVDYTEKTQFIFRINKGVEDITDDKGVNRYVDYSDRRIPFEHMIYIGDGDSDIPCMKLVSAYKGHSIAVYSDDRTEAEQMFRDDRVNFICKADYRRDSDLSKTVKRIVDKIVADRKLDRLIPDIE